MRYFLAFMLLSAPAAAADWQHYSNARFGVNIDVPPGFAQFGAAPANGDGLTFASADGEAELRVWGSNLVQNFKADLRLAFEADQAAGWAVSYGAKNKGPTLQWAVYSGTKGETIIYERAVLSCHATQAVHFRIEYPRAQKRAYDAVVTRLGRSLRAGAKEGC